jgi:hypothetical protein
MNDFKENNEIVYKRGIWKSFGMIIFLFTFIGTTLLLGLVGWRDGATWNKILSVTISYAKFAFIGGFILTFYAINSNTFYKSHIIVFYPFLFWKRKINYSEILFAEFIMVTKGSNVIHLYRKKHKRVSIETPGDHMKIFKLLNSNNISLVIPEKNIHSRMKKELEEAGIVYSNKKLH